MNWAWIPANIGTLVDATIEHIYLTAIAVGVGFGISMALAILVHRRRAFLEPVSAVTGALYTFPSLALFAILVPITGLSIVTAEIGLVSYTLLILVRNIVAGLDGVPTDIREAADGLGYTWSRRLVRVELPLAMPLIVAGLRIATVTTIGLVMVTALIGEGGLGQVMLRGFNFRNWAAVYSAAAVTLGLAIVVDGLLVLVGRFATPWSRMGR